MPAPDPPRKIARAPPRGSDRLSPQILELTFSIRAIQVQHEPPLFRCTHRLVQRIAPQHVATRNHQTNQSCLECRLRTKVCTPHCPERARWPALAKMQLRFSRASSDEHLFQLSQQHHRGQHVMRVDRGALCMLGAVSKHPTPLSVSARLADRLPGNRHRLLYSAFSPDIFGEHVGRRLLR